MAPAASAPGALVNVIGDVIVICSTTGDGSVALGVHATGFATTASLARTWLSRSDAEVALTVTAYAASRFPVFVTVTAWAAVSELDV